MTTKTIWARRKPPPGGAGLSLREALALANADADADTIVFASAGTLTLTNGELGITTDVTIDGDIDGNGTADITVSGSDLSRGSMSTAAWRRRSPPASTDSYP